MVLVPFGGVGEERGGALVRSGGDLLSRTLGCSTISGHALNGRVRDGIGCFAWPMATRPDQGPFRHQVFQAKDATLGLCMASLSWRGEGVVPCPSLDRIKPVGRLVPVN